MAKATARTIDESNEKQAIHLFEGPSLNVDMKVRNKTSTHTDGSDHVRQFASHSIPRKKSVATDISKNRAVTASFIRFPSLCAELRGSSQSFGDPGLEPRFQMRE